MSQIRLPQKQYLHIELNNIEIRHSRIFTKAFFSVVHNDKFHFSSAFSNDTSYINDDFIIQADSGIPQVIRLQRWQNCMILFEHQVDISQLKTRSTTKKKVQTKQNQIISISVSFYSQNEIRIDQKFIDSISQHYLIISQMSMKQKVKKNIDQSNYFTIQTSSSLFIVPILNSQTIIQLPEVMQFSYYQNDKLAFQSDKISSNELTSRVMQIGLFSNWNSLKNKLKLNLKWGINLSHKKNQNNILLQAHQLQIYDIQVKFDNFHQFANSKVKFIYGNKAFQINGEFNQKQLHFYRIIYMIIKSQEEQITIVCEKNHKIVAQAKFFTVQIISCKVATLKKKLVDIQNGKIIGTIKFKCEKAKTLSLPSNNQFWKECNKKKNATKIMMELEQLSINYDKDEEVVGILKTQAQMLKLYPIINFKHFTLNASIHEPVSLTLQQRQNVFLIIKQKSQLQDTDPNLFIGIAIINYEQLKLGVNCLTLPFYKNQQKTLQANCIINKVVPWPFIKGLFQPEILTYANHKTVSLNVNFQRIDFQPYFLTYAYQNKSQIYCILQVQRIKKVLILQRDPIDQLHFSCSKSSDTLNYLIDQSQYIKIKFTFLVSDSGKEQEIYGFNVAKIKLSELSQKKHISLSHFQIKNDFGIILGSLSATVHLGNIMKRSPFNKDMNKVKNDIDKVNKSIQNVEKSISKKKIKLPPADRQSSHNSQNSHNSQKRKTQNIIEMKLPAIKSKNNNVQVKNMIEKMKLRVKDKVGRYDNQKLNLNNQNKLRNASKKYKNPYDASKKQLQMIKSKQDYQKMRESQIKSHLDNFQQKLGEMKQAMQKQNIRKSRSKKIILQQANDSPEHIMKQSQMDKHFQQNQQDNLLGNNQEFQDNQFAQNIQLEPLQNQE